MNWYVLYTKSRHEKLVSHELLELGIEAYCPILKKVKRWSDRTKVVEDPLFKSYVFVRLEERQRNDVYKASGVVRYLFWLQKPAIVKDNEILAIKNMLNDFENSEIELQGFDVDDRVQIKSGPMIDMVGNVINKTGAKLEILLPALQMKLVVDTRKNKVEKM